MWVCFKLLVEMPLQAFLWGDRTLVSEFPFSSNLASPRMFAKVTKHLSQQ